MDIETNKLVDELFARLDSVKKEIKETVEKPSFKTNMVFIKPNSDIKTNMNVIKDVDWFVEVMSLLIGLKENHNKACKELELDISFKYNGYYFDEWLHDIKYKVKSLKINERKNTLAMLEAQLGTLLTAEQIRQKEAERITKLFNETFGK